MDDKKTTVTFNYDVYPYVLGDTVRLSDEELKRVDRDAKRRGLKDVYVKGTAQADRSKAVTPDGDSEAEIARAERPEVESAPAQSLVDTGNSQPGADKTSDEALAEVAEKDKAPEKKTDNKKEQKPADAKSSK